MREEDFFSSRSLLRIFHHVPGAREGGGFAPPHRPPFRVPSWLRRIPELVRAFDATLLLGDARRDERVVL